MKRLCALFLLVFFLMGCRSQDSLKPALELRSKLTSGNGCSFTADIIADYGDILYTFTLLCEADAQGNMTFVASAPETIAGIEGKIDKSSGAIVFDDKVLAFEMLAEGHIAPVSAPWVLVKSLIGGYITSCANEGETTRITVNDSYEDDALQLDIWLDSSQNPLRAEILYKGRRYLTIKVKDFCFL